MEETDPAVVAYRLRDLERRLDDHRAVHVSKEAFDALVEDVKEMRAEQRGSRNTMRVALITAAFGLIVQLIVAAVVVVVFKGGSP